MRTAAHVYKTTTRFEYTQRLAAIAHGRGVGIDPGGRDSAYPAAVAFISHGRWVARCPNWPDCHNAMYILPGVTVFMCDICWNHDVGNQWRYLQWPPSVAAIEAVLEARPNPTPWKDNPTHNWLPEESVADLHDQNNEHLVGG